jgi:hypothetical protein
LTFFTYLFGHGFDSHLLHVTRQLHFLTSFFKFTLPGTVNAGYTGQTGFDRQSKTDTEKSPEETTTFVI